MGSFSFALESLLILLVSGSLNVRGRSWKYSLPPGYQLLDGEPVDVTSKVIQVAAGVGTKYYTFDDDQMTVPIYIRDAYEYGWHYIVFDDPYNQDPGGGHFIVLQRVTGSSVDYSKDKIVYDAYLLSLEDSVTADIEPYDAIEAEYYREETETNLKDDIAKLGNRG